MIDICACNHNIFITNLICSNKKSWHSCTPSILNCSRNLYGALLGQVLPFDFTGIDFSMTALFVVILLDQVLAHPKAAGRCAVTGLLAGIICLFIFGSGNFLLPALIITVLFVTAFAQAERRKELP